MLGIFYFLTKQHGLAHCSSPMMNTFVCLCGCGNSALCQKPPAILRSPTERRHERIWHRRGHTHPHRREPLRGTAGSEIWQRGVCGAGCRPQAGVMDYHQRSGPHRHRVTEGFFVGDGSHACVVRSLTHLICLIVCSARLGAVVKKKKDIRSCQDVGKILQMFQRLVL